MVARYNGEHHGGARRSGGPPPPDVPASPGDVPSPSFGSDFEELFENLYDAALITDLAGKVLAGNRCASLFLGFDQAEFRGKQIRDFLQGSDQNLVSQLWENLKTAPFAMVAAHCRRKDSSTFLSEIAVAKLCRGQDRLVFFIRPDTQDPGKKEPDKSNG